MGIIDTQKFKISVLKQRELLKSLSSQKANYTENSNNEGLTILREIKEILQEIKQKKDPM